MTYRDSACPDCRAMSSGDCGKHEPPRLHAHCEAVIASLERQVQSLRDERKQFRKYICHAAWVGFQIAAGQPYDLIPSLSQLGSQEDGLRAFDANPSMTPEENHENWMRFKFSQGWRYGPIKDESAKTHYDLVPFNEMPEIEKKKDIMDLEARRLASYLCARTP